MSIRATRHTEDELAPPPLPPPRIIPGLGPPPSDFTPFERRHTRDMSGNSDYSSPGHSFDLERPDYSRKRSDITVKPDEGYHSLASTQPATQESLPRLGFMSHDQFRFRPNGGNDYDSSMLKKFDAKRTLDTHSPPRRSGLSLSVNDAVSRCAPSENRMHAQLPQLSLPIRSSKKMTIESPGHLTETPLQSAVSSRSTPFYGVGSNEYRSPIEPMDPERSPRLRSRRTNSGSVPDDATVSTQSSYDYSTEDIDFPMEAEASGIRRLHINDSSMRHEYHTIGQKRRASSPPGDEPPLQGLPGGGELLRRREGNMRASPTPRLTVNAQGGSMSSVSSAGRNNSYASSISLTTSATSMSSFGRRSPGGPSPGGLSPVDGICHSPFTTPVSLAHSPRAGIARAPHQRVPSDNRPLASPRKLTEVPKASISRIQGFFMCECCPKKPKKFDTAEELNAHEAEKQYECNFCGNRFKNKNEAERHQNSLHVRRHSWSCSALHITGYDKAFHDSTNRPGEADACGYCGDEFARNGGVGRARHPTEQDWDERLRHLQEVHKFRECNSSKKFYRADHFRQHLKHSHAGTSGKWTNMLETACMIEEEPPQPR
ncbi:uncharacterized protein BCR38DRAFT_458158 [Pseudomassariella vexata]|uniref:C2H2-type domain-containing protein n=1 Tax=Pseudomassariella vexata TaxID=1141098 RepID=A0A1Y2DYY1_9PEZI|nr:uncharacterized protein BCR38DRAFT_458158 [Pseudomassariella vexata]ORY64502.1 hypothetical protein BCR38DRAFT_458158 [Pseudomassariella vexata]